MDALGRERLCRRVVPFINRSFHSRADALRGREFGEERASWSASGAPGPSSLMKSLHYLETASLIHVPSSVHCFWGGWVKLSTCEPAFFGFGLFFLRALPSRFLVSFPTRRVISLMKVISVTDNNTNENPRIKVQIWTSATRTKIIEKLRQPLRWPIPLPEGPFRLLQELLLRCPKSNRLDYNTHTYIIIRLPSQKENQFLREIKSR